MKLTPNIKGQLTQARNRWTGPTLFHEVRRVFLKHMPLEQAKHAAKKYLKTA